MENDLKVRIDNMVKTYGTRLSFIADGVKLNQATLSRFLHGKQDLCKDSLYRIDKFLKDRNL